MTLDNVWQAELFRRRFLASCMQASSRRMAGASEGTIVNIVIVGGGATGVELAAELSHTVRTLAKYNVHTLDPDHDIRVSIIERGELLLPHLNSRLSRRAARYLRTLGVEVCTSTTVARVDANAVLDTKGKKYAADMTLWAAGIEGPAVCTTLGLPVNRIRQIIVNAALQTPDDDSVYAIGDCSNYVCPEKGAAVPPRAQVAHQQAMYLAEALAKEPGRKSPDFQYRDYGSLISLGPLAAVGSLLSAASGREMLVSGVTARVLYALMYQKHVMALHGFIRMAAQTMMHWLRGKVSPPVKLH